MGRTITVIDMPDISDGLWVADPWLNEKRLEVEVRGSTPIPWEGDGGYVVSERADRAGIVRATLGGRDLNIKDVYVCGKRHDDPYLKKISA